MTPLPDAGHRRDWETQSWFYSTYVLGKPPNQVMDGFDIHR
jgi:hypothetical protein